MRAPRQLSCASVKTDLSDPLVCGGKKVCRRADFGVQVENGSDNSARVENKCGRRTDLGVQVKETDLSDPLVWRKMNVGAPDFRVPGKNTICQIRPCGEK